MLRPPAAAVYKLRKRAVTRLSTRGQRTSHENALAWLCLALIALCLWLTELWLKAEREVKALEAYDPNAAAHDTE